MNGGTAMKRFVAAALAAVTLGFVLSPFPSLVASADGVTYCNEPYLPSTVGYYAYYSGNGHCTGSSVDAWRVKVGIEQKYVNWGPLPDDWDYVSGSYGSYSTWAAPGAYRYRENNMSCTLIKDNWQYRSRFKYETVWSDDHVTYGYYHSDAKELC